MKTKRMGFKRSMMLQVVITSFLVAFIVVASAWVSHSASPGWKPEKNVELVVISGPGSGSDLLARMIQKLWQSKGIVETNVTVVNKIGAGAGLAMAYLNEHMGDGHYLMVSSSSFLTDYITGVTPYKYTEFTPISVLGLEPILFSVKTESPIKTGKDLVDQLKKDPMSVTIGIANARGNHNHISVASVLKEAGGDPKKLKLVVFDGSSKAMMALMGGHVDLVASSVDSSLQHIQTGKIRPIALTSEKRLWGEVSNVPTWKEQGINVVYADIRAIVGSKGITDAQADYWDDAFAKLLQTDEWKKFRKDGFSESFYQNRKQCKEFLDTQYELHKSILTGLGLAK